MAAARRRRGGSCSSGGGFGGSGSFPLVASATAPCSHVVGANTRSASKPDEVVLVELVEKLNEVTQSRSCC